MDEPESLLGEAIEGLGRGDLKPFAVYLNSPQCPLDGYLIHKLVEGIEGRALYRIASQRTRRGRGPKTEAEAALAELSDLPIADFFHRRLAAGVPRKQAVWETQDTFGVGRTAVYASIKASGK